MSQAFSTGHHPLGLDLRVAMPADADDVARLLTEMGYPCEIDDALERIGAILDNDRQVVVVARPMPSTPAWASRSSRALSTWRAATAPSAG